MPELPEVETIRLGLAEHLTGAQIADVHVLHPRAIRRSPGGAEGFYSLVGARMTGFARRGKYLWADLGDTALICHLGMSGQLLITGPGREIPPNPHVRARFDMMDGTVLRFVDQRTFGHLQLAGWQDTADGGPGGWGSERPHIPGPVAHIARDLLDPALDESELSRRTRARRTEIKRAMLDQGLVSGLGNIYCDEALFRAGIHPRRRAASLSYAKLADLWGHARDVMTTALAEGGTSFDALYVNVNGASGYFDRSLRAYGRGGLPCVTCGTTMVREQFMNRSSTYCPCCQPYSRPASTTRGSRRARRAGA
ncbi:MAG: bifunctional DNA-formamidopyrimidine glycosylase/DNA-(apurinic or apyrimidinic site) lyase [Flaviflexus sp.]|nr:bifunctional DNA-formamidopyrimidine glycosylase/DNA-(apurinic or apyrimidinic site) lyase [Flaviflexus sp.]